MGKSQKKPSVNSQYSSVSSREESFNGFALKGNSDIILSWPYNEPSAESMAKLGFYFQPTKKLKDRVKCFCCNSFQQSWKNVADPTTHHLSKHPSCWFSKVYQYMDASKNYPDFDWTNVEVFNDPLGEDAIQTRLQSFGDLWPFDSIRGAKPTASKMVDAGFYYFSQESGDDLAMCIYCGIPLEGWEMDDDPLTEHEKRGENKNCYFLSCLHSAHNSKKRENSSEEAQIASKKSRVSTSLADSIDFSISQSSGSSEELSENESEVFVEAKEVHEVDESFSLSANDIQLSSEDQPYERSRRSRNISRSFVKNSSILNSPKVNISQKRSKILDSSYNNEDLFSEKNMRKTDISKLSPKKPILNNKSTGLKDITNVAFTKLEKVTETIIEPESDSESEYHSTKASDDYSHSLQDTPKFDKKSLVSIYDSSVQIQNTVQIDDGSQMSAVSKFHTTSIDKGRDNKEENSKYERDEDENDDSIILVSNSKEIIECSSDAYSSTIRDSPSRNTSNAKEESLPAIVPEVSSKKVLKSDHLEKTDTSLVSKVDDSQGQSPQIQNSNKSILSQRRFIESPGIKRSRSPFLDDNYEGSDDISSPDGPLELDDTPIEESTDHNIQIKPIESDKASNSIGSLISHKTTQNVLSRENSLSKSPEIQQEYLEQEEVHEDIFHSMEQDPTPSKPQAVQEEFQESQNSENKGVSWTQTNIDKVFSQYDDIKNAKEYLSEISKLQYELNDDIDGRVTYFINEMPENELEMTIEQWLSHNAKQGRINFEEICNRMILDYDEECERALEVLKNLPVSN